MRYSRKEKPRAKERRAKAKTRLGVGRDGLVGATGQKEKQKAVGPKAKARTKEIRKAKERKVERASRKARAS